jgi:hypothetical protein
MKLSNRASALLRFRSTRPSKDLEAFGLVELMIGTVMGIILVGSIGGLTLVSDLKVNRDAEVNQTMRDNWSRSLALIANEAQQAFWISNVVGAPTGYPCAGGAPDNPLVLDGPPNPANPTAPIWRVVYGVRSNAADPNQWRGVNRLVRCGPPFERIARDDTPQQTRTEALRSAAVGGNLSFTENYEETVVTDQLPRRTEIPCPVASIPGPCMQPFYVKLFNLGGTRDRDAQVNLFLSRATGQTYPPAANVGFHIHIRALRNPGFDVIGNPSCTTQTDSLGNQEPNFLNNICQTTTYDSVKRRNITREYNLSNADGNFRINSCGPTCNSPRVTNAIEIVYLRGLYDDFTTKQYAANDSRPCSRSSCFLSSPRQSLQIFDGNVVVFYDRILRL